MHNPFSPGEEHVDKNKGLDLVLVGLIMKAHKGKIEVSNNAHGAIVTLTFPCPKYQNIPVKEIEG
ncbi:hypothetical protein SAMN05444274_1114 [Mariniphaga anaerophila]|uniref:Histidine kinase-, DNA gyrase B-, and HSP90-like ATPase n=1 Tax=Mariniphaga anaerophila TaxID=1484053 RepID=A0A1M5F3M6_9BACT|nr:hypothetical protein [Mariniphaga anaerophila]SHF86139.1 hypothetical protein SAMN05444274_1114 [Mariniphaga anaerophila]